MTKVELLELATILKSMGQDIELEPEEAQAYLPQVNDLQGFYLPKVSRNFYYNPNVFRKLLGIK